MGDLIARAMAKRVDPTFLEPRVTAAETSLAEITKKDIVKNYGSITTGTTYPLSNKFATLAEAQAKYPNAGITTLTQELNWAIFNQAFYDANLNGFELIIPAGNYYIKDPLNVIGTQKANISIEYTNFSIKGEGIGRTIFIFNFVGDAIWAMDIIINSAKMNIGGFTIKNLQNKQGCGLRVNGLYSGNVYDILSIYFYIGCDFSTYISNIKNVTAGYCSCGIIWRNGTSTTIQNCYASNCIKRDVNDTTDWAGIGHYILGYVYSTLENLAADNCGQPYKVGGSLTVRIKLLNCGAEQSSAISAIYVDNINAVISVDGFSADGISGIANVQNVNNIEFNNITDLKIHNIIRGSTVSSGQIRINGKLPTTSNPSVMTGITPTVNKGIKGNGDILYDLINYAASDYLQNGRGIIRGNTLEFKIRLSSNGKGLGMKINILPYMFYNDTLSNFRAGSVFITAFNNGGSYTYAHYKATDSNIVVTITTVDATNVTILIEPFKTSPSPTAHQAIFEVETYFNINSNDQNVKINRNVLTIKGVDY